MVDRQELARHLMEHRELEELGEKGRQELGGGDAGKYADALKNGGKQAPENEYDEGDPDEGGKVSMSVPLLIRLMEYAKEDAKTDMDLHKVAERAQSYGDRTLRMDCYEDLVNG